jgi:hypothetical protein
MKCSYLLRLAVLGAACASAASAEEDRAQAPDAVGLQGDPLAEALGLKRYPLVELRGDLGEAQVHQEVELVRKSIDAANGVVQKRAREKGIFGRGDHGKSLGCYKARFAVSGADIVRPQHRAGIATPENLGRTFEAVVRFSNSEPKDVSDFRSATMGLAVKVLLDPAQPAKDQFLLERSGVQDFVAGGLGTFVSPSISEYADLFSLRIDPFSNALPIIARHPDGFRVFFKEPLLRLANPSPGAAPIVLENSFSSLLPYAWGSAAVKFRFEPCHRFKRSDREFSRFDSDYQSKVITRFLRKNDICYVMKIQVRPRPGSDDEKLVIDKKYPLDDATVRWPEPGDAETTPGAQFHEVARLTIAQGTNAMDEQACECLAFNPWHGLKAHQPLGSLNRARALVYKESEAVRKPIYRPHCPDDK